MWSKGHRLPSRGGAHTRWKPVAAAAPAARLRSDAPVLAGPFAQPDRDDPAIPGGGTDDDSGPDLEQRLADAHARGVAHGRQLAERAFADERARIPATVQEIASLRRRVLGAAEHDCMQLAVGMARRILHREVRLDPDILVAMARVALGRLGDRPVATIHLNPEDLAAITQHLVADGVTVTSDSEVPRGGCRIVSASGEIDLGVDAQMSELSRVLLDELSSADRVQLH